MNNVKIQSEVAAEVIALLQEMATQNLGPEAAQELLRPLRIRWPDLRIELLWQEEPFDHSFHFDVLVREASGDTLSISLCTDRQLPWPLRGAQRWSEFALVTINGRPINANEAFGWLDFLWEDSRALRSIIDTALIHEELDSAPLPNVGEEAETREVQEMMDAFRRSRGLLTAEATRNWLDQQGLEAEDLDRWARRAATTAALRRRVAAGRGGPERHFQVTRGGWDRLLILRVAPAPGHAAGGLAAALTSASDKLAAATQQVQAGRASAMELLWRRRHSSAVQVPAELVVTQGPRPAVEVVLRTESAELDDVTREEVVSAMFTEWSAERRQRSRIEWHWGRAVLLDGKFGSVAR